MIIFPETIWSLRPLIVQDLWLKQHHIDPVEDHASCLYMFDNVNAQMRWWLGRWKDRRMGAGVQTDMFFLLSHYRKKEMK